MGQSSTKITNCKICHKKLESQVVSTVCGHLYHENCISKKEECTICKKRVNPNQLRRIFFGPDQKEFLSDLENKKESLVSTNSTDFELHKDDLDDDLKKTIQRMETKLKLVEERESRESVTWTCDRVERIERMKNELQEIKQIAKDLDVFGATATGV